MSVSKGDEKKQPERAQENPEQQASRQNHVWKSEKAGQKSKTNPRSARIREIPPKIQKERSAQMNTIISNSKNNPLWDRLYVSENGAHARGSRPIARSEDFVWRIKPGTWYGWPDYFGGVPVTDPRFKPAGQPQPEFLLESHPQTPPSPLASLGDHVAAGGMDFARGGHFGSSRMAFVALSGDLTPATGVVGQPAGFKIVVVDTSSGKVTDFATNRSNGPASKIGGGGFERPLDVRFDRSGKNLYVTDFGTIDVDMLPDGKGRTGTVWKISRN